METVIPDAPKPKKRRTWLWVILGILVLWGLVQACSGGNNETAPAPAPTAPAVVETQEPAVTPTEEAPAPTETAEPAEEPEPEPEPVATISGGDHVVGPNFAPGVYRADVSAGMFSLCTISQTNTNGNIMNIRNANSGSVIFAVADEPGTTVSFSGCSNIGLAHDRIRTDIAEITNGDWLVGDEVAPGSYTCAVDTSGIITLGTVTQTGANGSIMDIRNANEGNVVFNVQDAPGSVVSFSGCESIVAN